MALGYLSCVFKPTGAFKEQYLFYEVKGLKYFSLRKDEGILSDISNMEWGTVTPEFSNESNRTFVHVFNHCLQDKASVERSIRFAVGRIRWCNAYLKNASLKHEVIFDDVGQRIGEDVKIQIRRALKPHACKVTFLTERG